MLTQYQQRCQLLLGDKDESRFNVDDLTVYINWARGQIAGQAECVRVMASLNISSGSQSYLFSALNLGNTSASGVQGVVNVRQITYGVGTGYKLLHPRSFPYFNTYYLAQPNPVAGPPTTWSQFAQGAAGSLYVNLLDGDYTCAVDTACYPADLSSDSSPEAIPYQWTDAVPFFACSQALVTIDPDRSKAFMEMYNQFGSIARVTATPSVVPSAFAQAPDPVRQNRLGLQQSGGRNGAV